MRLFHFHKWEYVRLSCIVTSPNLSMDYQYRIRYCRKCQLIQKELSAGGWADADPSIMVRFNEYSNKAFNLIKELREDK
jgi:hypothetical protein